MITPSKRLLSLFLIISLISISCFPTIKLGKTRLEYSKDRKHGAVLIILHKDSGQIRGELIAVKERSLLLLSESGADVSIDIRELKVIKIVKKSKVWQGVGIGFSIGAIGGAVLGAATDIGFDDGSRFGWVLFLSLFFGVPSAAIGGIVGAVVGIDRTIQIEGMSDLEIQETLDKLRKKARIRDYK